MGARNPAGASWELASNRPTTLGSCGGGAGGESLSTVGVRAVYDEC